MYNSINNKIKSSISDGVYTASMLTVKINTDLITEENLELIKKKKVCFTMNKSSKQYILQNIDNKIENIFKVNKNYPEDIQKMNYYTLCLVVKVSETRNVDEAMSYLIGVLSLNIEYSNLNDKITKVKQMIKNKEESKNVVNIVVEPEDELNVEIEKELQGKPEDDINITNTEEVVDDIMNVTNLKIINKGELINGKDNAIIENDDIDVGNETKEETITVEKDTKLADDIPPIIIVKTNENNESILSMINKILDSKEAVKILTNINDIIAFSIKIIKKSDKLFNDIISTIVTDEKILKNLKVTKADFEFLLRSIADTLQMMTSKSTYDTIRLAIQTFLTLKDSNLFMKLVRFMRKPHKKNIERLSNLFGKVDFRKCYDTIKNITETVKTNDKEANLEIVTTILTIIDIAFEIVLSDATNKEESNAILDKIAETIDLLGNGYEINSLREKAVKLKNEYITAIQIEKEKKEKNKYPETVAKINKCDNLYKLDIKIDFDDKTNDKIINMIKDKFGWGFLTNKRIRQLMSA